MRAALLKAQGTLEELIIVEVPEPSAPPGGALVKLHAASLNHRDSWIRQGLYARIKLPCILGSDGAGVIEAVGEGVDAAQVGRRVVIDPSIRWGNDPRAQGPDYVILGMPDPGTFAERIAQPLDKLHTIPAHLSFQEAAALPVAGVTAYRALVTRGEAKRGEHVLITGIGGGVATLALVFAKALGCDISVTSSSDDKIVRAKALGAKWGISYKQPGWEKALVKEAGRPPDVILDGAGGEGFGQLVAMAGPGARIVTYGATRALPSTIDLRRIFFRQIDIRGSTMGHSGEFVDMLKLIDREKVRPVIDRVFTLDQVREAHARMDEGEQLGKIVLDLGA